MRRALGSLALRSRISDLASPSRVCAPGSVSPPGAIRDSRARVDDAAAVAVGEGDHGVEIEFDDLGDVLADEGHPQQHFAALAAAGADTLVFHAEVEGDARDHIAAVRALGCNAGIALNPGTPASAAEALLALAGESQKRARPQRGTKKPEPPASDAPSIGRKLPS